jgi:hypothetical protein
MKGKNTWKPVGLRAKRWRPAGQNKAPADLLPSVRVPKGKALRIAEAPK